MKTQEIRRYRRALRQFQQLAGTQFKTCSCSVSLAQCLVLLDIDEHGQVTMGQLASHLRLDQSTLSRTVDGLVRKKLVERLQDDLDRRVVLIKLTTEGDSLCQEIHSNNDQFSRGVFEKIPPNEREIVIRGFEMLVQAYQDHET